MVLPCYNFGCCPAAHSQNNSTKATNAIVNNPNKRQAKTLTESARQCNQLLESEEAISLSNKAIALDPKLHDAYLQRAIAYIALDQKELALADLNTATASETRKIARTAYRERADLLCKLKRYSQCIQEITTFEAKFGPLSDGMLQRRAECYLAVGKPALAVQDLSAAIQKAPDRAYLIESRARAYCALKDWKKSLADCNNCIAMCKLDDELLNNKSELLNLRASLYDKLGQKEVAAKDRQRAKQAENYTYKNAPFRSDKSKR